MSKTFIAILILFTALAIGCDLFEERGKEVIRAYDRTEKIAGQESLRNIKTAIRSYHALNGKYPETLEDIENFIGSSVDPELYEYNPEDGELKLINQ